MSLRSSVSLALLVVLDRSGSMAAQVQGKTKISLADQGAVLARNERLKIVLVMVRDSAGRRNLRRPGYFCSGVKLENSLR